MGVSKTCAWEDVQILTTLEIRDVGQQMHISEIQVLLEYSFYSSLVNLGQNNPIYYTGSYSKQARTFARQDVFIYGASKNTILSLGYNDKRVLEQLILGIIKTTQCYAPRCKEYAECALCF